MIRSPRGTNDILPNSIGRWHYLEEVIRKITSLYNYSEIRTPIFESTEVFSRSIGETSDIVNKEMYTFLDRSENSITLRPEMTAALVRSCIQNSLANRGELERLWYYGPFFRYERPQKGRFRQFHQFGVECLSSPNPESDAEVLLLANHLIKELGIADYTLNINSIGNSGSREVYRNKLVEYFSKYENDLSYDSQSRLKTNPLRILDSKDENDKKLIENSPNIVDSLDKESKEHFEAVLSILEAVGVNYNISNTLVRGLDYYSHTVFEFQSNALGSQDSFGGGGRYDGLFEQLGGKPTPAVGFAMGVERLVLILEAIASNVSDTTLDFYVLFAEEELKLMAIKIAEQLRNLGFSVANDLQSKSLKSQMKDANKNKSNFVLILGKEEFEKSKFILKNMVSGQQQELSLESIATIKSFL
jgi:histidyl-tRNA synthetase